MLLDAGMMLARRPEMMWLLDAEMMRMGLKWNGHHKVLVVNRINRGKT